MYKCFFDITNNVKKEIKIEKKSKLFKPIEVLNNKIEI